MTTDPLRAALAEALCFHRPPEVPNGVDHWVCSECRAIVGRVMEDPAVLAALDRSDRPTVAELRGLVPDLTGGLSSEDYVRGIRDGDRSDPAVGLPICSECGVPIAEHPDTDACAIAQEAGVCPCWRKMPLSPGAALAATPTASPTAPTHVHEWEAWDSTDPNESWFACVSGCSSIVRRRLASPTATGERDG